MTLKPGMGRHLYNEDGVCVLCGATRWKAIAWRLLGYTCQPDIPHLLEIKPEIEQEASQGINYSIGTLASYPFLEPGKPTID